MLMRAKTEWWGQVTLGSDPGRRTCPRGLSFTEPVGTLRAVRHMNFISILGHSATSNAAALQQHSSYNTLREVWGIAPGGLLSSLADGPRNGPSPQPRQMSAHRLQSRMWEISTMIDKVHGFPSN